MMLRRDQNFKQTVNDSFGRLQKRRETHQCSMSYIVFTTSIISSLHQ